MIRLRELREARHMSQQKLAIELNITQAAVSKYELGLSEPDVAMLKNIANYFQVSVDYIIGMSDSPAQITTADMPAEEIKVVRDYRRLNSVQKEKALAYIQGLLQE